MGTSLEPGGNSAKHKRLQPQRHDKFQKYSDLFSSGCYTVSIRGCKELFPISPSTQLCWKMWRYPLVLRVNVSTKALEVEWNNSFTVVSVIAEVCFKAVIDSTSDSCNTCTCRAPSGTLDDDWIQRHSARLFCGCSTEVDANLLPVAAAVWLWWCFDNPQVPPMPSHTITCIHLCRSTWLKILCRPDCCSKIALPGLNLVSRFTIRGPKKKCPTMFLPAKDPKQCGSGKGRGVAHKWEHPYESTHMRARVWKHTYESTHLKGHMWGHTFEST